MTIDQKNEQDFELLARSALLQGMSRERAGIVEWLSQLAVDDYGRITWSRDTLVECILARRRLSFHGAE